jgi:hypothetical protein
MNGVAAAAAIPQIGGATLETESAIIPQICREAMRVASPSKPALRLDHRCGRAASGSR